jgi:hypothetical protein
MSRSGGSRVQGEPIGGGWMERVSSEQMVHSGGLGRKKVTGGGADTRSPVEESGS